MPYSVSHGWVPLSCVLDSFIAVWTLAGPKLWKDWCDAAVLVSFSWLVGVPTFTGLTDFNLPRSFRFLIVLMS